MSEPGEYSVSPNNIHLESSFRVPKEDFERELKAIREQYPDSQVWNRSIESHKREWATHNAFHAMGIFRERSAHLIIQSDAEALCRAVHLRDGALQVVLHGLSIAS